MCAVDLIMEVWPACHLNYKHMIGYGKMVGNMVDELIYGLAHNITYFKPVGHSIFRIWGWGIQ